MCPPSHVVLGRHRADPATLAGGLHRAASVAIRTLFPLALLACSGDAETAAAGVALPLVDVESSVVTRRPFDETTVVEGIVTARPEAVALVAAPFASPVERILVRRDDPVRRGDMLITVDRSVADADAHQARISLDAARSALARAERLERAGVVPTRDVEQARVTLAQAEAAVRSADRNVARASLRAPINGIVARINAAIGVTADPTQPSIEIVDSRDPDVVAFVPARTAARVVRDAPATLWGGSALAPESLGVARVRRVGGVLDSTARGIEVRLGVSSTSRPLRVGEAVEAQVVLHRIPDALVIPVAALVPEGDRFHVFVIGIDSIARRREVTVLSRSPTSARIGEGLTMRERVVTVGAYGISDSARVRIRTPGPNSQ